MPARRRIAATLALAAFLTPLAAASASAVDVGDSVWIGDREGYGGTGAFPVFTTVPADPAHPGTPEFWAYCIEHNVTARPRAIGTIVSDADFLGDNHFTDPGIPGKLLWVLAHSYPAVSLADFGAAAGVPGISRNDALEATQYAIWRYTELTDDAPWRWETPDSEAAYWYLIDGVNANGGMSPSDFTTTVTITPPAVAQTADSLVGPFIVHTNRPTARVSVSPGVALRDANGNAIDPDAVIDGQELYLDLRGTTAAGAATVTASVTGSSAMGRVISVATTDAGTPTVGDHSQTIILVAPATAQTTASASVRWAGTGAQLAATGTELVAPLAVLAALLLAGGAALTATSGRRAS